MILCWFFRKSWRFGCSNVAGQHGALHIWG
jgi:hypothetical protein